MFESLETRQMFSVTIDTNPPPSQAVTPMANVTVAASKGRQTFADTLSTNAMVKKSADTDSTMEQNIK